MNVLKRVPIPAVGVAILLGLSAAFYGPAFDHYFVLDDFFFLERSKLRGASDLLAAFSPARALQHSYRPVSTDLYFGLMQAAVGVDVVAFHWANLVLLTANAVLVFVLLSLFGMRPVVSAAMALVYPVCAVNFRSQLWISVIQDLSATFFFLIAFTAYASARRKSFATWPVRVALISYVAAVLSKETAITLVAVLFIFDWLFDRKPLAASVWSLAPFLAAAAGYLLFRSLALDAPLDSRYAMEIGWFVFESLGRYASATADAVLFTSNPWILGAICGVAGWALFGTDTRRRRLFAFGLLWYFVTLAPVLPLIDRWSIYYLMMPIVGALISVAALFDAIAEKVPRPVLVPIAAVVMAALFWGMSREKFQAISEERNWARSFGPIVEAVQRDHPTLPANTRLYFSFPAGFPGRLLLSYRGAVFRVVYDEPTLKASAVGDKRLHALRAKRRDGDLIYRLDAKGHLLADPGNRIARPQ